MYLTKTNYVYKENSLSKGLSTGCISSFGSLVFLIDLQTAFGIEERTFIDGGLKTLFTMGSGITPRN